MAENSSIEWTDNTFNPWIGCTKVSPGCANCYAAAQDNFRKWTPEGWGKGKPRRLTKTWDQPRKWEKAAARDAYELRQTGKVTDQDGSVIPWRRPRVFCSSLADWLDDEVPIEWLSDLLYLVAKCPTLDWQMLTKRPQLWQSRLEAVAKLEDIGAAISTHWLAGNPPPNVWLGTTVEDQTRANERIPELLKIPARVRFLSCEPLLGPVNLEIPMPGPDLLQGDGKAICQPWMIQSGIHWVIAGGESGPGARPMHPEWTRSLRDQCQAAGVPFLFKQWGEFAPGWMEHLLDDPAKASQWTAMTVISATDKKREGGQTLYAHDQQGRAVRMDKPGKKAAGRLLDGREWNQFPNP